jgi:single-strand DNA-binding protein
MLKATAIGNLGNDPEMRYSANGSPFLRFNLASNDRTRTPEGEWKDTTEWVRVTVFGQRAESLGEYLKKGSRVYVDGRLEARPWTDNAGQVRAGLEVIASEVEFMSARGGDDEQPARPRVTDERRDQRRMPEAMAVAGSRGPEQRQIDDLEDLPF